MKTIEKDQEKKSLLKKHKFYNKDGSVLIHVIAKTLQGAIEICKGNNINLDNAYVDMPKQ